MTNATHVDRELVPYSESQVAQRILVDLRRDGRIPDLLWLLEHPPTITWGASGGLDHLLERPEDLESRGVVVIRSDRGGDITCHEPGQLVGYPIVDLGGPADRDLYVYLRRLERAILSYLGSIGIQGVQVAGRTGVWIEGHPPRKIAAMGVRVKRWVASHGFALNVENDLAHFGRIVPCGIQDVDVTSVAREIRRPMPRWHDVTSGVHQALEVTLGRPLKLVVGREGLHLPPQGPA